VPRIVCIAVLAVLLWAAPGADAVTLQPVGSFNAPIFVTSDPADPDRLFVVERSGVVVEAKGGVTSPYAEITDLVSCCAGERGLLSIALAPDFPSSGRFYAFYTGESVAGGQEGDIHVDSFRPGPGGGAPIREPILQIAHAVEDNHNGGQLQFGPDGFLYIATGDGGGSGDPFDNGQDTDSLLGKVLRIDPRPGQTPAYVAPPGNPFLGGGGLEEIWAYGLRNPWRFSFDRLSGDMIVADVGQGAREEIDYAPSPAPGVVSGAGSNYGWDCREGSIPYPPSGCADAGGFVDPVFDYPHDDPGGGAAHGCSIIGGYVVRDPGLADLYGRYVYGDLCGGEIRSLVLPEGGGVASGDRSEGLTLERPVTFGEDAQGRLYVASAEGSVYRFHGEALAASPAAPNGIALPSKNPRGRGSPRLRLRFKGVGGRGVRVVASVVPCTGRAGEEVQLSRGGRPFSVKRLGRGCVARFFARVARRATFKAVLRGTPEIRSSRLVVIQGPAG
jgi:Glucose / Sorbosone dehydrogenase